jgi:retron-type reverse transcriptase
MQTKLSNLSKLPSCKVVTVEISKTEKAKRLLGISMPIDKVLQRMFLTFLDVIIEEKLKPEVFAYRKGRDAKMAVATVYSKVRQEVIQSNTLQNVILSNWDESMANASGVNLGCEAA